MVELSMGWLEDIKEKNGLQKWLELVETLRGVTEGKVPLLPFALPFVLHTVDDILFLHIDFPGNISCPRHPTTFSIP